MKKKQIERGVNRIGILVGFATAIAWFLFLIIDGDPSTATADKDLDKIRRNVDRIHEQGGPLRDIEKYLAYEGVSFHELDDRSFTQKLLELPGDPADWIFLILTTIIIGVVGFAVLPILIRIVFWVADGFAKDE